MPATSYIQVGRNATHTEQSDNPKMLSFRQLVVLWCALAVLAQEERRWVAPREEDCTPNKTHCNTLQGYNEDGAFNRSKTEWTFMKGKHSLSGGVSSFVNASNIVLTGEPQCEGAITECSIHCEGEQVCMFLFASSNNITIQYLHFVYPKHFLHPLTNSTVVEDEVERQGVERCYTNDDMDQENYERYNNCIHDRSWVFLNVHNVTVRSVRFTGYHSHWAIISPSGNYLLHRTEFSDVYLAPYCNTSLPQSPGHLMSVVLSRPMSSAATNIELQYGQFNATSYFPELSSLDSLKDDRDDDKVLSYPVVHVISQRPLEGWKADITIASSVFLRCAALQLSAVEDSGLSVTVDNVDIDGEATKEDCEKWNAEKKLYMASAIRLLTTNNNCNRPLNLQYAQPPSNITIKSSRFQRLLSGKGIAVILDSHVDQECPMVTRIILKDNDISNCYSQQVLSSSRSVITARQKFSPRNAEVVYECPTRLYRLIIDSNHIHNNFLEGGMDKRCLVLQRHNQYLQRQRKVNSTTDCQLTCYWQGTIYVAGFSTNERVLFRDNEIECNKAQGVTINSAVVEVAGHNLIYWSSTHYGAGIMLIGSSHLLLRNGSHLNVSRNQAYVCGGGIYILDKCSWDPFECSKDLSDTCSNLCFFQFVDNNGAYLKNAHLDDLDISVTLDRNKASAKTNGTASMIFNSNIDQCHLHTAFRNANKIEAFQRIFLDPQQNYTDKEISSIPRNICRCSDNGTHCQLEKQTEIHLYPGQNFTDNIVVIGDMGIHQSALVYIELINRMDINQNAHIPLEVHSIHVLGSGCNHITAPPLPNMNESANTLALQLTVPLLTNTPNKANNIFLVDYIHVRVNSTCPPGYDMTNTTTPPKRCQCTCLEHLEKHNIVCSLQTQTFILPKNHWIGMKPSQKNPPRLVFARYCPAIHCATAYTSMEVALDSKDVQCRYGRTGVLCGQCPENKSVMLGSLVCGQCDSNAGILIVLFYIVAGPLLIAFICLLNLTVSTGSINGIFLYVTIIGINKDVLKTSSHPDKILSLMTFEYFIESCVYIGMDEFALTLGSYFFPLYLLFLVGVAMCLPKWRRINMHKINRLIGPRITPVLATVILLSYTKLAVRVIKSLLAVQLFDAETGEYTYVWMFDGNLEYFHSIKHIVLATLALLVFAFFLLPVTVIAIFGDLFRRFFKGPWYMNFLDTLHGAYRFRFGFWIGIRLLIGVVISILKVSLVEPKEVYLATATIAIAVLLFQNIFWPYRAIRIRDCVTEDIKEKYFSPNVCQKIVHSIDNCYLINIMFVFMFLVHQPGQVQGALSLSIVAAGLEFVGILIYHALEYTPLGQWLIDTRYKLRRRYRRWKEERREAQLLRRKNSQEDDAVPLGVPYELVLRASDCRDSDSTDSIDSDSDDGHGINGDSLAVNNSLKKNESQKQTERQCQRRAPSDRDTLRIPLLKH